MECVGFLLQRVSKSRQHTTWPQGYVRLRIRTGNHLSWLRIKTTVRALLLHQLGVRDRTFARLQVSRSIIAAQCAIELAQVFLGGPRLRLPVSHVRFRVSPSNMIVRIYLSTSE